MRPPDPLAAGTVVAGKYRLLRVLGEGAMGRVVAAMHLDLDREVALKFMVAQRGVEEEMAARFMREARAAAKLTNEHVVRIFDVGRLEDGAPYLVMELLAGEDLATYLGRMQTLDPFEAADIVSQACQGIADAHRAGIVHRDVKPQNLFLCSVAASSGVQARPGRRFVKVLDFGLSKIAPALGAVKEEASLTKVPLGSPLYMAPEQLRSSRDVDARADVWALGTTLYEILTGEPPFIAPSLGEIYLMIAQDAAVPLKTRRPAVPFGLDAIVMRCLEKDPSARYPNAQALGEALTRFLSSNSNTAQIPLEPWKAPPGASSHARAAGEMSDDALDPIGELPTEAVPVPDAIRTRVDHSQVHPPASVGRGSLTSSTSPITPLRPRRSVWLASVFVAVAGGLAGAAFVFARRGEDQVRVREDAVAPHPGTSATTETLTPHGPTVVPGAPLPPESSAAADAASGGVASSARSASTSVVSSRPAVSSAPSLTRPPPDSVTPPLVPLPVPVPVPIPTQHPFDPTQTGRNF